MRALIAGGTGFVGRALAPALTRLGHEVRLGTRRTNMAAASTSSVRCDLDDDASVRAALAGVDLAYFLVHGLRCADYGLVGSGGGRALRAGGARRGRIAHRLPGRPAAALKRV